MQKYRIRKTAVDNISCAVKEGAVGIVVKKLLWETLIAFEGYPFRSKRLIFDRFDF